MSVFLHAIETVVPSKSYTQTFALKTIQRLVADTEAKANFLQRIYQGSGISKRHSVVTDYDLPYQDNQFYPKNLQYLPEPSTQIRNDFFTLHASRLVNEALQKIIPKLPGADPSTLTHLITVSCTGFSAPGFDYDLILANQLNLTIERFHVAFMGCFGAFPALRLATHILRSNPSAKVLIVNCELCSVHLKFKWDTETQVANALFADGVSVAFLSSDPKDATSESFEILNFHQTLIPSTTEEMSWKIGEHGFDMRLSSYVPKLLEKEIKPFLKPLLDAQRLTLPDINHWAIHPGGKAILDKLKSALSLETWQMEDSYTTLQDFGNMSSATVFFVLKSLMEKKKTGKVISCAFGPGLTMESTLLKR